MKPPRRAGVGVKNRCFGQFGLTPWLILHTYYIEQRPSLEPRGMRCRAVLRGV